MYVPVIKKRTVVNLSFNMIDADIRAELSRIMQIPEADIPPIQFKEKYASLKEHSQAVENIIADYKVKLNNALNVNKDKIDELYDIGRFIYSANKTEPFEIEFSLDVPEQFEKYPDFILTTGNKRIGVEHTRLMNEEIRKMLKTADYYISKAEKELKDIAHLSKTVNLFIDFDKNVIGGHNFRDRKFTNEERHQIPHLIADYIRSKLTDGNQEKPEFIDRISTSYNKDSRVDIELIDAYFTETDFAHLLFKCINKKEAKASNYRKATNVDKLWLLIIVDDNKSSSGFNLEPVFIPHLASSNFDNIFLFEKFGGEIIPLFPNGGLQPALHRVPQGSPDV